MAQNMVNGKVYIGQTVRSLGERKRQHFHDGLTLKKNYYFYNALRKYGKDNFSWRVLCECSSIDELNQKEIEFIAEHRSAERNFGYNIKSGGFGGHLPEETKEKIRIANTGYKHSDDAKKKMSVAKSGDGNPNFGKRRPDDVKEKISQSNMGKKMHHDAVEKMRQKKIGFVVSEETKLKIRKSMIGRSVSEGARANMTEAQRRINGKPVIAIDKITGNIEKEFECISDAVREFGDGSKSSIFRALNGSRKSACGFVWKYVNKEININKEFDHVPSP